MPGLRTLSLSAIVCAALLAGMRAHAQHTPMDATAPEATPAPVRTRLILKDGTFQLVLSYQVAGKVVRYRSAERDGETEEVPLALVDLAATRRWARDHGSEDQAQRTVLSPELAREEADRAARTPVVAPDLRLPEEDSVVVLDTFQGTPELVPLSQQNTDLNRETAHAVQPFAFNPLAAAHEVDQVPSIRSDIQLHVSQPVFYIRIGGDEDSEDAPPGAMVVHAEGRPGREVPAGGSEKNGYVVERLDVRGDTRVVDSFRIHLLGTGQPQPDVIEMQQQTLPGGHWMKLTPAQPLLFGEYALIEILSSDSINRDLWDFGVHPDAKENAEAQRPTPPHPITLQHHE